MDYEGQICRPPMERASFMLPVAVGCSHNACKFCMLFKHLSYRELPMEQIEEEILRVKAAGGCPKRIFLGDGNAFQLPYERLMAILELIHTHLPSCTSIHMDATVTNIKNRTDSQLAALAAAGVDRLYLGIETGLDDVLKFMVKDHSLQEAYEQIDRIHAAGIGYGAHYMTGIAGRGRGIENAEAIAEFFNRTKPECIINFSLFLHKHAALWRDVEAGRFLPASELENLREDRRILELLEVEGLKVDCFHDGIVTRVRGTLPRDLEKLLASLDTAIEAEKKTDPRYNCVDW